MGEVVEVTDRGELVAILSAPSRALITREALIASGQLVAATTRFQLPTRRSSEQRGHMASELLSEERNDRF